MSEKRVFEIKVEVDCSEKLLNIYPSDLEKCLRSNHSLCEAIKTKIVIVPEGDDKVTTEDEVYKHLLEQVKESTDADQCYNWTCALDRFCDAIRTRNGG